MSSSLDWSIYLKQWLAEINPQKQYSIHAKNLESLVRSRKSSEGTLRSEMMWMQCPYQYSANPVLSQVHKAITSWKTLNSHGSSGQQEFNYFCNLDIHKTCYYTTSSSFCSCIIWKVLSQEDKKKCSIHFNGDSEFAIS